MGRTGRLEEPVGDAASGLPRHRTGSSRHLPLRQGSNISRRRRGTWVQRGNYKCAHLFIIADLVNCVTQSV